MAVELETQWAVRDFVVQRKVFRVEQMFAIGHPGERAPQANVDELKALHRLAEQRDGATAETVRGLTHELTQIRDTVARNKRELAAMIGDGKERRMARAADELRASVDGMDYATQKILKSVEVIDDSAKALAAAQKTDYETGLTQEIQDQVVAIYEACNFQDLAGQRIGNVLGMMTMVEDQILAILDRCEGVAGRERAPVAARPDAALLNGPKLEGDAGHASQSDIDAMFD
jgi:chemotaxis protein CheZ